MKKFVFTIFLLANIQMAHAGFEFQGTQNGQPYGNCTHGSRFLGVMLMGVCYETLSQLDAEEDQKEKDHGKGMVPQGGKQDGTVQ